jgi:structural maintenance of chromosome 4
MSTRPTRRAAAKRKQIIESDDDDEIANSPSPPPADEDDSEEDFTPAPAKSSRKSTGARRKTIKAETPPASEAPPRRRGGGRPRKSAAPSVAPDATNVEQGESSQVADPDQTSAPATSAPRRRGRPKKQVIKQESVEPEASIQPSVEAPDEPDEHVELAPENAEPDQTAEPDPTAMDVDQEETPVTKPGRKRKSVAPPASTSKEPPTPEVQQPQSPATPRPAKPSATPDPDKFQTPLSDITNTAGNDQRRPIEDTLLNTGVKPVRPLDTVMEKPMDIVLKSRTMVIPQVEDLTPKPRLVITYLILTNFKSYSGRQEVGPFHASFSSVVGPNGSGKSNVIDSLLFVFGFRASKMRQGKLSALIHNSADHPNLDHCEVAVHFREVLDQV